METAGARPVDVMKQLGLLSWRSLLVGWRRGWATRQDIVEHAVRELVAGAEDRGLRIATLAGADRDSDEEVLAILLAVIGDADQPVDQEAVRKLTEWQPSADIDRSLAPEFDQWRLAHLLALSRGNEDPEAVVDRAEEIWAEFGYPEDMKAVSRSYASREGQGGLGKRSSRRGGPAEALKDAIEILRRRVGATQSR